MGERWVRTTVESSNEVLIAVALERFTNEMYFGGQGRCRQALIRGYSAESKASFEFETGFLNSDHMERFERLGRHGFTVVAPPSDWRYRYPAQEWHNQVIVDAIGRIEGLPTRTEGSKSAGYDVELARAVMESLNEAFPAPISLIELKYQFSQEPDDIELSSVLNALRGDGYIDGVRGYQSTKLNPRETITLTKEGRRHLADEMKTKSTSQQPYSSSEASGFILKKLLAEFRERKLTASDLQQGYEGFVVTKLKELAAVSGICDVDFDLALKALEEHHFVKTGPLKVGGGQNYNGVFIVPMTYSMREYLYLTDDGYVEAKRIDLNTERLTKESTQNGGRTLIQGDQYINYGHAGAIGPHSTGTINNQQWTAIQNEVDLNALTGELEQLRKYLQQSASSSSDYQRLALLSEAEEHAKKHDGSKTMEVLSRVGKAALDVAKDIGTEIAAKVIAKSMGIEH